MKPLSQTELIRQAWITALRQQGHRQCRHVLSDGLGKVCALGLLMEVSGSDTVSKSVLTMGQASVVAHWNDKGASFAVIADGLEELFAWEKTQ